jgi:hypothetical protein
MVKNRPKLWIQVLSPFLKENLLKNYLPFNTTFLFRIGLFGKSISSQKSVYLEVLCCQPDIGDELGAVAEDGVQHLAPLVRSILHIVLLLLLALNQLHQLQYLYT